MTLDEVSKSAIDPAMALLPENMDSPEARVLLLAIGLQESKFEHRLQQPYGGPAHGFWQFEKGGGVKGVCNHPASAHHMDALCEARDIEFTIPAVYEAIVNDDVLAAGLARLLLWTDPAPLPGLWHYASSWDYYQRNWRPGKPHPRTWPASYGGALKYLGF